VFLAGHSKDGVKQIPEATFKSKVLKILLHTKPLKEPFSEAEEIRAREARNVVRLLNMVGSGAFALLGSETDTTRLERVRRMSYQSALKYVFSRLKDLVSHELYVESASALIEKDVPDDVWKKIGKGIERLAAHPAWELKFDVSPTMSALEDALQKNQEMEASFKNVVLTGGYLAGIDTVTAADLTA
jgi:hypothetical protein